MTIKFGSPESAEIAARDKARAKLWDNGVDPEVRIQQLRKQIEAGRQEIEVLQDDIANAEEELRTLL